MTSEAGTQLKGFVIPKWLAWVMVFAGIIVGAVVFYIGYKNAGFILTREEIIDRWGVLIENGGKKMKFSAILKDLLRRVRLQSIFRKS